jgi:hypothetical protein
MVVQSVFVPYSEYQRLLACEVRVLKMENEKKHHEASHGQSGSGRSGAVGLVGGGDGVIQGMSDAIQKSLPGTLNVVSLPPPIDPLTYPMVFPENKDRCEQEAKRAKSDGKAPQSLPNATPLDTGERTPGHNATDPWYFKDLDTIVSDDEDEDLSFL